MHRWKIFKTRGGAFSLVAIQFKAEQYITSILLKDKLKMNVKTTSYLMCVGFKRCFIKFSFHFEGGAFGSEGVHLHAQGVLAHPQNP